MGSRLDGRTRVQQAEGCKKIMEATHVRYPSLTRPGRLGSLPLPHRMLMGSMHLGIEGDAKMLDRIIQFYEHRVRGGAALIMTGGVAVHHSGWEPHRFLLSESAHRRDLSRIADAVHRAQGRIALQLFHAGRYARCQDLGYAPWAPSAVKSQLTHDRPTAISPMQIATLLKAYEHGGRFAAEAGFDAVEIMGSEGYLLNSFLSPLTNQRLDQYGGTMGGLAFVVEAVQRVREGLGPGVPLLYRLSGWDLMGSDVDPGMLRTLTRHLAEAGVDGFNVGIGWHESRVPTVSQLVPQGAFAEIAGHVRQNTSLPVIAANRIMAHELADTLIGQGLMDFVAPARPWLADPAWALRALDGGTVNPCIACNQACLDRSLAHPAQPVSCMVNPRALDEKRYRIHPTSRTLTVAVVGAGPAGLQAASALAELGHRVTLFEASDDIGGQLRLAAKVPGKEEISQTIVYFRHRLNHLGVNLVLKTAPDLHDLSRGADAVIVATGVDPLVPALPGGHLPHVRLYPEAFAHPEELQGRLVILGGGGIGLDLALYLSAPDGLQLNASPTFWHSVGHRPSPHAITVVTRGKAGRSVGRTTRWILRDLLRQRGVDIQEEAEARAITPDGVWVEQQGAWRLILADHVVLALGQVPHVPDLGGGPPASVSLIGGARRAKDLDAVRAIREGLDIAYRLTDSLEIPELYPLRKRGDFL